MWKRTPHFFPRVPFLTHVFRKFKLDLTSETSAVKVFQPFDRSILHRMKLLDIPSPPQSSTQVPKSPTEPPPTLLPPSQPTPPHFFDAYYNSFCWDHGSAKQISIHNGLSDSITQQSNNAYGAFHEYATEDWFVWSHTIGNIGSTQDPFSTTSSSWIQHMMHMALDFLVLLHMILEFLLYFTNFMYLLHANKFVDAFMLFLAMFFYFLAMSFFYDSLLY